MSTLIMMRAKVNPQLAERIAKEDPNPFAQLASGNHEGLIRHRVFAADGELVVIDEWNRAEDWQRWRENPEVREIFTKVMGKAGITEEPQVLFAEEMDLGDRVG